MEKHFRNPPTHPSQKITGAIYMMKWSTGTRNMTANLKKFTSQRRLYFSNFLFGNKVFIAARVTTVSWQYARADLGITFRASAALLRCALRCRLLSILNLCLCFSFECTAWWRVYIYYVWLCLGSREYRLIDQTLRE